MASRIQRHLVVWTRPLILLPLVPADPYAAITTCLAFHITRDRLIDRKLGTPAIMNENTG